MWYVQQLPPRGPSTEAPFLLWIGIYIQITTACKRASVNIQKFRDRIPSHNFCVFSFFSAHFHLFAACPAPSLLAQSFCRWNRIYKMFLRLVERFAAPREILPEIVGFSKSRDRECFGSCIWHASRCQDASWQYALTCSFHITHLHAWRLLIITTRLSRLDTFIHPRFHTSSVNGVALQPSVFLPCPFVHAPFRLLFHVFRHARSGAKMVKEKEDRCNCKGHAHQMHVEGCMEPCRAQIRPNFLTEPSASRVGNEVSVRVSQISDPFSCHDAIVLPSAPEP